MTEPRKLITMTGWIARDKDYESAFYGRPRWLPHSRMFAICRRWLGNLPPVSQGFLRLPLCPGQGFRVRITIEAIGEVRDFTEEPE